MENISSTLADSHINASPIIDSVWNRITPRRSVRSSVIRSSRHKALATAPDFKKKRARQDSKFSTGASIVHRNNTAQSLHGNTIAAADTNARMSSFYYPNDYADLQPPFAKRACYTHSNNTIIGGGGGHDCNSFLSYSETSSSCSSSGTAVDGDLDDSWQHSSCCSSASPREEFEEKKISTANANDSDYTIPFDILKNGRQYQYRPRASTMRRISLSKKKEMSRVNPDHVFRSREPGYEGTRNDQWSSAEVVALLEACRMYKLKFYPNAIYFPQIFHDWKTLHGMINWPTGCQPRPIANCKEKLFRTRSLWRCGASLNAITYDYLTNVQIFSPYSSKNIPLHNVELHGSDASAAPLPLTSIAIPTITSVSSATKSPQRDANSLGVDRNVTAPNNVSLQNVCTNVNPSVQTNTATVQIIESKPIVSPQQQHAPQQKFDIDKSMATKPLSTIIRPVIRPGTVAAPHTIIKPRIHCTTQPLVGTAPGFENLTTTGVACDVQINRTIATNENKLLIDNSDKLLSGLISVPAQPPPPPPPQHSPINHSPGGFLKIPMSPTNNVTISCDENEAPFTIKLKVSDVLETRRALHSSDMLSRKDLLITPLPQTPPPPPTFNLGVHAKVTNIVGLDQKQERVQDNLLEEVVESKTAELTFEEKEDPEISLNHVIPIVYEPEYYPLDSTTMSDDTNRQEQRQCLQKEISDTRLRIVSLYETFLKERNHLHTLEKKHAELGIVKRPQAFKFDWLCEKIVQEEKERHLMALYQPESILQTQSTQPWHI